MAATTAVAADPWAPWPHGGSADSESNSPKPPHGICVKNTFIDVYPPEESDSDETGCMSPHRRNVSAPPSPTRLRKPWEEDGSVAVSDQEEEDEDSSGIPNYKWGADGAIVGAEGVVDARAARGKLPQWVGDNKWPEGQSRVPIGFSLRSNANPLNSGVPGFDVGPVHGYDGAPGLGSGLGLGPGAAPNQAFDRGLAGKGIVGEPRQGDATRTGYHSLGLAHGLGLGGLPWPLGTEFTPGSGSHGGPSLAQGLGGFGYGNDMWQGLGHEQVGQPFGQPFGMGQPLGLGGQGLGLLGEQQLRGGGPWDPPGIVPTVPPLPDASRLSSVGGAPEQAPAYIFRTSAGSGTAPLPWLSVPPQPNPEGLYGSSPGGPGGIQGTQGAAMTPGSQARANQAAAQMQARAGSAAPNLKDASDRGDGMIRGGFGGLEEDDDYEADAEAGARHSVDSKGGGGGGGRAPLGGGGGPKRTDYQKKFGAPVDDKGTPSQPITTMMLKNIPCRKGHEEVMNHIDQKGFTNKYDFFYLPKDVKFRANLGYAFINFVTPEDAARFQAEMNGYRFAGSVSTKACIVVPAHVQGLNNNLAAFKRTEVMRTTRKPFFSGTATVV